MIHATAVVDSQARIAPNVEIGPFCVVDADVEIGEGTVLISHVVLGNGARIGRNVTVSPFASIGMAPQDLKYKGEATLAIVGDNTVVRESVTINRGTVSSGRTVVGSDCLLMAYSHVAHDCVVGNNVIMANSVQLGGHVEVGDWAILGGTAGVHQFVRVGAHSMTAANATLVMDVPPYTIIGRSPSAVEGINRVGLSRRGYSKEQIEMIDDFYRVLYRRGLNTSDGIAAYEREHGTIDPLIQACITFIRSSKRGTIRGK